MIRNSIYFVGASVTAQKGGWVHKFHQLMMEKGFGDSQMIVNAIGGTDILFGAANHNFYLNELNECPPKFAFIEYSTGDLNFRRSAEKIEPFLSALARDLQARGTKVFFVNLYRSDCVGVAFEASREVYRRVADTLKIKTLDIYLEIEREIAEAPSLKATWYRDNVHTTDEGASDVAKRVLDHIGFDLFIDAAPKAIENNFQISISSLSGGNSTGVFEYRNTGQIFGWNKFSEGEFVRSVATQEVYGAVIITGPRSGFVDVSVDGSLHGVLRGFDHNSYYERPMPVIFKAPIAPGMLLELKLSSLRSPDFSECKVAHPDFGLSRELKVVGLIVANFETSMEEKVNFSESVKTIRALRQAGSYSEGISCFLGLDRDAGESIELLYEYLSCLYLANRVGEASEVAQKLLLLKGVASHHYVLCIKALSRAYRYDLLKPLLPAMPDNVRSELGVAIGGAEIVASFLNDSHALMSEGMVSTKEILTTDELIKHLTLAIKSRAPTSFVRIRDAEGCLIGPTLLNNATVQHWRDNVLTSQFGKTFIDSSNYADARSKVTHLLVDAINDADMLGVLKASQMNRLRESYVAPMQMAGNYFNYAYIAKNKVTAKRVVDSCVHHELQFVTFVRDFLMHGETPFGIIGPHESLAEAIRSRSNVDFIFYQTPSEARFFPVGTQKHYPDVFKKIAKGLKRGTAGRVYFVGAGVLGKVYCNIIKQNGGVAIDVGSLLDLFAGHLHTRSPLGRIKGVHDLIIAGPRS